MGNAKFLQEMGHNRRQALGDIDQNIIGVTLNPFMVNEAEFKGYKLYQIKCLASH